MPNYSEIKQNEIKTLLEEKGVKNVKVGVFDLDGILRGKYISREKFLSSLDSAFGFCDVVLGWDSNDQLYDNVTFTGWHTAYPDAPVRIIPDSMRVLPFEENTLFFLGEFSERAQSLCPRSVLKRVLELADKLGFEAYAAFEYEFFVFNETPDSARQKSFRNLKPFTPGNFGYSVIRNSVHSDFYHELLDTFHEMRIPLEGLHTETGPGVLEAAITVDKALEAADRAALFKTFTKVIAQRRGLMASFMAKWSNSYPGQSGHIHMSLKSKEGNAAFFDENDAHHISKAMRHFIGGQQALMPQILAMISPTVNSYSRLIPGYWAPTSATWGIDNRTCALRVIEGSPKSQRVEYRIAAADANPYLALAASLASGLWGIENEVEPVAQVQGSAYDQTHPSHFELPRTLWEAAQNLKKSDIAKEYFGDEFVEHYAATREWEEREFRKHITDWELARYFEII